MMLKPVSYTHLDVYKRQLLYTEPDHDNRITVSGALEVAAKAGAAVANELYHADIEGRKAVRMTAGWTTPLSKAINSFDLMSFYFRLKDGVTLEDFDKETITLHPVQTYTEEQLSTGEDFGVEVRIFESSPAFAYKYSDVRESGYFESLGAVSYTHLDVYKRQRLMSYKNFLKLIKRI